MRDPNDVYVDDVFDKLKQFIKRILRLFIRFLKLVWSKKIILLALILVGFITGYFMDRTTPTKYETVLQVRTLQSSTEYVYNLINNLNRNLGDSLFLTESGLNLNELERIEIAPMANMEDLLSSFRADDSRTLETLILNTSTEDLLTSEFFRSQYSQHQIRIEFGTSYNQETPFRLLELVNSNPYYRELHKLNQNAFQERIKANQNTLEKIDTLVKNYNANMNYGASGSSSISALLNEQRATSIFELLRYRTELVRDTEILKIDFKELEAPITLTNKPVILEQHDLFDKKKFIIPFILVSGFLLFLFMMVFFRKVKRWVQ